MKNIVIILLAIGYVTLHMGYSRWLARVNVQFNALDRLNGELLKKYERCHNKS